MRKDFINQGKTESSYLVKFDYAQNFLQFQNSTLPDSFINAFCGFTHLTFISIMTILQMYIVSWKCRPQKINFGHFISGRCSRKKSKWPSKCEVYCFAL